ncbi:MAG: hypothetical protein EP330_01270 [Deltaproteobacteria bacterium]|nr:MAG: hypothetical protein EP330_01270 [Deltaproteobacteria bacterium]
MTRYGFDRALSALFLADYDGLRAQLPDGLWPLEAQTGFGIVAVTAFDFVDSEVGAYGELVFSVLVPPFAPPGEALPDAAYFPFFLATTTEASRTHAAERWLLPAHASCLDIAFDGDESRRFVTVSDGDAPVLRLQVGEIDAVAGTRRYQCFSSDGEALHRVFIDIEGALDEHEEERGHLELARHPIAALLGDVIEDELPFREQSMARGEQRFGELLAHGGRA